MVQKGFRYIAFIGSGTVKRCGYGEAYLKEAKMWYVLQTITGSEKELVDLIYKLIPHDLFDECFIMQRECLRKVKGGYHLELTPLFPSYVFLKTNEPFDIFMN